MAAWLFPWLPVLVGALLFVSAFRIGPQTAFGSLGDLPGTFRLLFLYQLVVPLIALAIVFMFGWEQSPFALALVLVLSGPSVVGSSNLAILLGKEPGSAMRLMIVGTGLFPITVIPILWLLPAFPTLGVVIESALRLLVFVGCIAAAAFALRGKRVLSAETERAFDGMAGIILAVAVVGLMAAVGPTLRDAPALLGIWLLFAMVINFGAQGLAFWMSPTKQVGPAIVAGNRNIALFLVALPPDIVAQIVIFIGVYQVPMYLTPIVMNRIYRSGT